MFVLRILGIKSGVLPCIFVYFPSRYLARFRNWIILALPTAVVEYYFKLSTISVFTSITELILKTQRIFSNMSIIQVKSGVARTFSLLKLL